MSQDTEKWHQNAMYVPFCPLFGVEHHEDVRPPIILTPVDLVPKGCGHVMCAGCTTMFNKKSGRCYVCEVKCREKDLVELYVEGTGFAAGGKAEAKKEFVAFQ